MIDRGRGVGLDPEVAWSPWEPTESDPWDLAKVGHLHRRAGFGGSWDRLSRDLERGPEESVESLIQGESTSLDGYSSADFDDFMARMGRTMSGGDLRQIQKIWLYRLIHTHHPLRERMTLFWHDHFATSNEKVSDPDLMSRQNRLLRRYALGSFADLLVRMGRDPAMLIYLDASTNRKAQPNENYAREVMELFSLGLGNYTERDIQEAARAFTGTFVINKRYRRIPGQHDDGLKKILGQSADFDDLGVVRLLLDQPACGRFLCTKFVRAFVNELDPLPDGFVEPLAASLREANYDITVPIRIILRSRFFYDATNRRRRIKSPVDLVIGTIRSLEVVQPTVELDPLAESIALMGQELYAPPNVSGWDGGRSWINTTRMLARTNFVLGLLSNEDDAFGGRFDPEALSDSHGFDCRDEACQFFRDLLVQVGTSEVDHHSTEKSDRTLSEDLAAILSSPIYQLA